MNTEDVGPVIKATEAAKILGITVKTIKNWIANGYINGKKIGGRWYIDGKNLRSLLSFKKEPNNTQNAQVKDEISKELRGRW